MSNQTHGWRIVVGNDEAGVEYKNALRDLLEADPRVASVEDIGVGPDDTTAYPHVAVDGCPQGGRRRGGPGPADLRHGPGRGHRGQQGSRHPCGHRPRQLLGGALGAQQQRPGATMGQRVIGLELAKKLVRRMAGLPLR